ncbi:VOC family protein [Streptomyces sp. MK37H]|nr:VOC family protein [Streptomyces sp. MK37H]
MTDHQEHDWADGFDVQQVRVARPTDRLADVVRFYRDGLGLTELFRFEGHDGYDGVMLGLPGKPYHLEFTQHAQGSPGPAPTRDNLLVFYVPDAGAIATVADRLASMGHPPVEAENPYWEKNDAITIEDPDGWRVVLVPSTGI